MNDVIKENNQLKTPLVDNKNIEEKMKNLIDENKKNQNINAIIMLNFRLKQPDNSCRTALNRANLDMLA